MARAVDETKTEAAIEAYVFGYPLVLMDATRQAMATTAPSNRLIHRCSPVGPDDRAVVRPNTDTLYSTAWLDLTQDGLVVSVPGTEGRYYVLQLLDAYSNVFASVGTRTTGTNAFTFAIMGPQCTRATCLPSSVVQLRAPTDTVWLIARLRPRGVADEGASVIQRALGLHDLSAWESGDRRPLPATCAFSDSTGGDVPPLPPPPPPCVVASMPDATFFTTMARLYCRNPPSVRPPSLDHPVTIRESGNEVAQCAMQRILCRTAPNVQVHDGWRWVLCGMGDFGSDFLLRAQTALRLLGANVPQDAVYMSTATDTQGRALVGTRDYVMRFAPGRLPPARGFWSVTLYDQAGYLVANAARKYAVSDEDTLRHEDDGSVPLFIQRDPPATGWESNWLPAPPDGGPFNLLLRLYWPCDDVLQGRWVAPPIDPSFPDPPFPCLLPETNENAI